MLVTTGRSAASQSFRALTSDPRSSRIAASAGPPASGGRPITGIGSAPKGIQASADGGLDHRHRTWRKERLPGIVRVLGHSFLCPSSVRPTRERASSLGAVAPASMVPRAGSCAPVITRPTRCEYGDRGWVGRRRSRMLAPLGVRPALRRLQGRQAVTMLSQRRRPPRRLGFTWSIVISGPRAPQVLTGVGIAHQHLTAAQLYRRVWSAHVVPKPDYAGPRNLAG